MCENNQPSFMQSEKIRCDKTGRLCDRKIGKLATKAGDLNEYSEAKLDEFAIRHRGLHAETTARIGVMAEAEGLTIDDIEDETVRTDLFESIELRIAEFALSRPVAVVACDGQKMFGFCGAHIDLE